MISEMRAPARLSYGRIPNLVELKDLIATQIESFHWFKSEGLRELFDEINPITDYTGKNFELKFLDYEFGQPKFSVEECRNRDMTYAAPLRIRTRLTIKETGEIKESEVYMGDFAMMTDEGTFIVNGTERVVVSQLVRSPGVYFTAAEDPNTGRKLFGAKLIPNRGAWLEIETSAKDLLTVKIDRKRKVPVTVLLKALELPQMKGTENDREAQKRALMELFGDVDNNPEHRYMEQTLEKDTTTKTEDALLELYRRVRPGDPPSVDNARNLLQSLFFNPRRFDLGRVGRYKVDKRLGRDEDDILEALDDPVVIDCALTEGGWFQRFLDERGALLPEDEAKLVTAWMLVKRSAYEIAEVRPGTGLTVRDIATGDRLEVRDRTFSEQARHGELICARVVPDGESHQFIGGMFPVVPGTERDILALCEDERGYELCEAVAAAHRPPVLQAREGEPRPGELSVPAVP